MNPKLAYLCSSISWGGLEMNQLKNAFWMHQRGHDVVVIGIENSPIVSEAQLKDINVLTIEKHRKYYDFKSGKNLAKKLMQLEVTHLIVRDNRDISLAVIAKRLCKRTLHLSYFMEMQLGVSKKGLFHSIRYSYLDLWSCPLNWLAEQVESQTRVNPKKIKVIPSGLDFEQLDIELDKFKAREILNLPKDNFIFGLIGRFDEHKGQLLVLEAFKKIDSKKAILCFLGEPNREGGSDYFERVQDFINQNGLEDDVIMRPFRKDVHVFYKAIDCCVMASKAETFGMVTIESLFCGTPVLASNAGGSIELIEDGNTGLLFESLNSTDLAEKMSLMLAQRTIYQKDKLRKSVEKFDAKAVCFQVESVLDLPHPI
jgi:glycosyltransferase involved in cell wall biosynthesis